MVNSSNTCGLLYLLIVYRIQKHVLIQGSNVISERGRTHVTSEQGSPSSGSSGARPELSVTLFPVKSLNQGHSHSQSLNQILRLNQKLRQSLSLSLSLSMIQAIQLPESCQ